MIGGGLASSGRGTSWARATRRNDETALEGLGKRVEPRGRCAIAATCVLGLCIAAVTGCDPAAGTADGASGAAASAEPTPPPSASAAPPPADKPSMEVQGEGVKEAVSIDKVEGCTSSSSDLATYLQRGELTLAGRASEVSAAWLVQLTGRAQIGFAGFNEKAEKVARDRGIGNAREHAPRLFAHPSGWTVAWFDPEGLAYAHPTWEAGPGPDIQHLAAVREVSPEDVALAASPSGSLIAASPFGADGQLSVFLFAPLEPGGEPVTAVGVTKTAKSPRHPAVVGDESGYTLAWHEGDHRIVATRLSLTGKESSEVGQVVVEGGSDKREGVALAKLGAGSVALWSEKGELYARALDPNARATSPIWKIGTGKWPSLIATPKGALVAWVIEPTPETAELWAVRIGEDGPAKKAVIASRDKPVKGPPAVAVAGDRVAFAWTEPMSTTISSRRAVLRIADAGCL